MDNKHKLDKVRNYLAQLSDLNKLIAALFTAIKQVDIGYGQRLTADYTGMPRGGGGNGLDNLIIHIDDRLVKHKKWINSKVREIDLAFDRLDKITSQIDALDVVEHKAILYEYYINGSTLKEICKKWLCSEPTVYRTKEQAELEFFDKFFKF